jgi:hypothetical protein
MPKAYANRVLACNLNGKKRGLTEMNPKMLTMLLGIIPKTLTLGWRTV